MVRIGAGVDDVPDGSRCDLFDRGDNVEAAWSLVDPILDVWSAAKTANVPQYASGSWGPRESDALLERDGRKWYTP